VKILIALVNFEELWHSLSSRMCFSTWTSTGIVDVAGWNYHW